MHEKVIFMLLQELKLSINNGVGGLKLEHVFLC